MIYTSRSHPVIDGSRDRNLEVGTWNRKHGECCFLACSLAALLKLKYPRTAYLRMVLLTVSWSILHQLIIKTTPTDMPICIYHRYTGQSDIVNSPNRAFFSDGPSL